MRKTIPATELTLTPAGGGKGTGNSHRSPVSGDEERFVGTNYQENASPVGSPMLSHFLTILSKNTDGRMDEFVLPEKGKSKAGKMKVFVCASYSEIRDINPSEESFTVRIRLYVAWKPHLEGIPGKPHSCEKARGLFSNMVQYGKEKNKAYWNLNRDEIEEFTSCIPVPDLSFLRSQSVEETDEIGIRIYHSMGAFVLWNQEYNVVFNYTYDLRHFPFDGHDLSCSLKQNNSQTWDLFDVTVHAAQFHKSSLDSAEWLTKLPRIEKSGPKLTNVILRVERLSTYYVQNIVGIMTMLSVTGFSIFALGEDSLADRINTILTLLLTAVAFKFAVADSMPKVGYNTLLDVYFLINMMCLFKLVVFSVLWGLFAEYTSAFFGKDSFWSLNRILCIASVLIYITANLRWAYLARKAKFGIHRGRAFSHHEKGKNWYCVLFATPAFFLGGNLRNEKNK